MSLTKNYDSIIAELKNPGDFEGVNIHNNVNSMNGVTAYSIEMTFTNGKNLPKVQGLNELAKEKVATLLKYIRNKSDYNTIQVEFVSGKQSGFVSSSTTMSFNFSPEEFTSSDSTNADSAQMRN